MAWSSSSAGLERSDEDDGLGQDWQEWLEVGRLFTLQIETLVSATRFDGFNNFEKVTVLAKSDIAIPTYENNLRGRNVG